MPGRLSCAPLPPSPPLPSQPPHSVLCRSIGTFARALLDGAKKPQISLRLGAAAASRDITLVRMGNFLLTSHLSPPHLSPLHHSFMRWTPSTRTAMTSLRPRATLCHVAQCCVLMSWRPGLKAGWGGVAGSCGRGWAAGTCVDWQTCVSSEEAKRFEEGLQEQKDFLYIQRKYVSP